jgi:hypothetical protein
MPAAVVFLEAPGRSQELLTLKWLLRSSDYEIASTWHDASPAASLGPQAHWGRLRMEEMRPFDTLVVLRRDDEEIPAQLGLTVGFAAARRLEVIWIGVPLEPLSQFRNVHCFPNLEAFQKHLLLEKKTRSESSVRARLVA